MRVAYDLEGTAQILVQEAIANLEAPPVNARRIARDHFGVRILWDADVQRASIRTPESGPVVLVKEDDRNERVNWAIAHELGEWLAENRSDVDEHDQEAFANRFAALLLTPPAWFTDDCRASGFYLPDLKEIYSTASNEVIARRMLDVEPACITIVDNGKIYLRKSSEDWAAPKKLHPLEELAQRECNRNARATDLREGTLRVQAWPVHENGFQREILRTTVDEFAQGYEFEESTVFADAEFAE